MAFWLKAIDTLHLGDNWTGQLKITAIMANLQKSKVFENSWHRSHENINCKLKPLENNLTSRKQNYLSFIETMQEIGKTKLKKVTNFKTSLRFS